MKLINKDQELTSNFWIKKPLKKRNLKNEAAAIRADWIDQTCKLLNRPYPQMAKLLKPYPTIKIQEMLETAKSFVKNPAALWWKLYKKSRPVNIG